MNWKIARDPYYSNILAEQLETAGFFMDSSTINRNVLRDPEIVGFPLNKMYRHFKDAQNPVVLVLTGCLAPAHAGHVEMMAAAKREMLRSGFDKVFCLFSPDHDEYVRTKTSEWPIDKRAKVLTKLVNAPDCGIDWWPSLFNSEAINFTDVLTRIGYQTRGAGGRGSSATVPVLLVCGEDNARFALTFQNMGGCVIVGRPNYSSEYTKLVDNTHIFFAECANPSSSTNERKISQQFLQTNLFLRVNCSDWRELAVAELLQKYYATIHIQSLTQQINSINLSRPIISMDPMIPAKHNFAISRIYDYMGVDKLGYGPRVGHADLEEQAEAIPDGEYVLYDDDIASGETMKFATSFLADYGVKIIRQDCWKRSAPHEEILDARDFIVGHPMGGLTIQQRSGRLVRRNYTLPHVMSGVRASVLDTVGFSEDIKKLNETFF